MKRIIFLIFLIAFPVNAQDKLDSAFKKLIKKDGLEIYFVFYSEGNGINDNGVVIYLSNKNDYRISYHFKLIFRADTVDKFQYVSGILKPLERKTGSNEGLFFIPFKDKRTISEVGITNYRVEKKSD